MSGYKILLPSNTSSSPCTAVLNAQSAQGLSFPAYVLETLSYAITLVYSYRNEFPFSTYGENFFLTLQNAVITLLIIAYTPAQRGATQKIVLFAAASIATAFTLNTLPTSTLSLLQITTLPLSLSSKLPQIFQNKRDQSTGQLSAVAVIAQVAGCAARLFTTATEVGDPLVASGFVMALLLNIILGAQMWMYWGKASVSVMKTKTAVNGYPRERTEKARVSPTPEPAYYNAPKTPAVLRISTPPPRTPPSSIGRKWARKVD